MKYLIVIFLFIFLSLGCTVTENPTNPKADDPLILGEEVVPPIGCLEWQAREGVENADC